FFSGTNVGGPRLAPRIVNLLPPALAIQQHGPGTLSPPPRRRSGLQLYVGQVIFNRSSSSMRWTLEAVPDLYKKAGEVIAGFISFPLQQSEFHADAEGKAGAEFVAVDDHLVIA
ncbi:MAG TPA: hypothetical protein VJM34_01750, partial [Novosphingobium sp.]|nr:hypothetical protein [Novosphingobium sp.]